MFAVAQELHMPVFMFEHDMPVTELFEWAEVFRLQAEARKKAKREAKNNRNKGKRPRRARR